MTYPQQYPYYPAFQQTYQQPITYQQPTPPPTTATQNQILVWVQSEEEATKFPLNAGQSIFLMNQNEPYLYMKSIDQLGKPTFIKKRLEDEGGNNNDIDLTGYIKREEIENLITDKIQKEVEKRMSEISFKPTKSKRTVVEED